MFSAFMQVYKEYVTGIVYMLKNADIGKNGDHVTSTSTSTEYTLWYTGRRVSKKSTVCTLRKL